MKLKKLEDDLTVCKIPSLSEFRMESDFFFICRTDEEISLVCRTEDAPRITSGRVDHWKAFRIQGILDFSLVGILSEIAAVLASNQISIFTVSTYNTDYILVKSEDFVHASDVLIAAGYRIED